jgi:hypothetical protein
MEEVVQLVPPALMAGGHQIYQTDSPADLDPLDPDQMVGAHGRNCTTLAAANALQPLDDRIVFDEDTHTYHVDGVRVPTSVTSILKKVLDETPFDANLIITKNLASWRRNPRSKYNSVVEGKDDSAAVSAIKKQWSDANRLGTKLHAVLEFYLNGELVGSELENDQETKVEWGATKMAVDSLIAMGAKPYRTELSVFWTNPEGKIVCAGQMDVLMKCDEGGELVLCDLKRTDKPLDAEAVPFGEKKCVAPLEDEYANDHTKYSLQLACYSVMLEQTTGLKVPPANRFLLRSHPSSPKSELIGCKDFDKEARQILDAL